MSGAEIKKYILQLEEKFPVNRWQVNGVDVWPYIRIKLYIFLLNIGTGNKPGNPENTPDPQKKILPRKIFEGVKRTGKAMFVVSRFFRDLKPKRILFFGAHFHRTRQESLYFNRFFDSMVDAHQLQEEVYNIEFGKVYEKNYNQQAVIPLHKYLDHYKTIQKLKNFVFSSRNEIPGLDSYESFYEQLVRDFPNAENLNISLKSLSSWAKKINRTKGFFIRLFKKTKPEKVIFLSYYGYDDLAAAILAAQELGIKTVDFQHGPQTNVHMAYSAWTKHPEKPYNTMPLEYWNWDERSQANIQKWIEKGTFVQAKIAGHPYMAYHHEGLRKGEEPEKVFFSLQTLDLEEMLPLPLLDLIKRSDLTWVLRMHPRSNFSRDTLESFLTRNGINIKSCEIEEAFDSPLPKSLVKAKLHVTNFSGCIIEAQMLNIPSIILHESGKEIFHAYIDNKQVFYLDPSEQRFEESFHSILKKHPPGFIRDSDRKIFNPLNEEF